MNQWSIAFIFQCFDFELDDSDMFKLNSFHEKYYRGMPHNW